MVDVLRLYKKLNIYICCHINREANRTTNCLAKMSNCIIDSNIWRTDFPINFRKFTFEDYCGFSFNRICMLPLTFVSTH